MLTMIDESKQGVIVLTTSLGLIQEDIAGIFDSALPLHRSEYPLAGNN